MNLKSDPSLVRRWITAGGRHKTVKIQKKSPLQKRYIEDRLSSFAKSIFTAENLFGHEILSVEKKFNLNGSVVMDSCFGGGGIMTWVAFKKAGKSEIAFADECPKIPRY